MFGNSPRLEGFFKPAVQDALIGQVAATVGVPASSMAFLGATAGTTRRGMLSLSEAGYSSDGEEEEEEEEEEGEGEENDEEEEERGEGGEKGEPKAVVLQSIQGLLGSHGHSRAPLEPWAPLMGLYLEQSPVKGSHQPSTAAVPQVSKQRRRQQQQHKQQEQRMLASTVVVGLSISPVSAAVSPVLLALAGDPASSISSLLTSSMANIARGMASAPGVLSALGVNAISVAMDPAQPVGLGQVSASQSPRPSQGKALAAAAGGPTGFSDSARTITYIVLASFIALACGTCLYCNFLSAGRRRAARVAAMSVQQAAAAGSASGGGGGGGAKGLAALAQKVAWSEGERDEVEGLDDLTRADLRLVVDKFNAESETRGYTLRRAREKRAPRKKVEMTTTRKLVNFDVANEFLAFREGGV